MQADAAPLITHVWTVLYAVTHLCFGNTASSVAPELVQRTVTKLLVLSVGTLSNSIASPRHRNAPPFRTQVLVIPTGTHAVVLVRVVVTVRLAITVPQERNAATRRTLELIKLTLPLFTVHLITAVITVYNAVAHKMSLKALATGTLEVARTSLIHTAHLV